MNVKKFFRRASKLLIMAFIMAMFLTLGIGRMHGVTSETSDRLVIDGAAIFKNFGRMAKSVTLASVVATDQLVVSVCSFVPGSTAVSTTFTAVSATPGTNEFLVGVSDTATASNLATLIGGKDNLKASANGAVITVTAALGYILTITTPDTTMTIATVGSVTNTLIGAARDGSEFTLNTEYRKAAVDGAYGDVKGFTRKQKVDAKLTVMIVEVTKENLLLAIPGATASDYPATPETATHDQITRAVQIALSDYVDNVAVVGVKQGTDVPIVCIVKNVLNLGNFGLGQKDNDEAGIKYEFSAHFDPANMAAEPWEILSPKEA